MRAFLTLLLAFLLSAPLASASFPPEVRCDVDDDLYQHCNVGEVHFVYGPLCAGVKYGGQAQCHGVRGIVDRLLA